MSSRVPTPARVERALAEVYDRPEFAPPEPSALRVWITEAWGAIRDFVLGLLPDVELPEGGGRVLAWIGIALLVVMALGIVLHFTGVAAGLLRSRDTSRRVARDAVGAPLPRGVAEWETRARRAAAEGRWREAVLALYPALLLRLDDHGALRYDAAKTPGEYRRETRGSGEAHRTLEAFLRLFEPVAFGGRPADGAAYDRLREVARGVGVRG